MDKNVSEVLAKYVRRESMGMHKYGVTTERTDVDLRGWLSHLQEELMDATIYVQRLLQEVKEEENFPPLQNRRKTDVREIKE